MCKYGLIGSGMMGQEHIRNIALLQDVEVACVFEPDAGMRAETMKFLPQVFFAETLKQLLEFPDLDALVIASPNHLHAGQLTEIANSCQLPILVEKPLYTDPAQRAEIDHLRETYSAPIWVAMEYRYMPPVARLVETAQAHTGDIKMLTIKEHRFPFLTKVGDWNRFNRNTGGTLVEKCCHFFDLMRLILKDDPIRVMASGGQSVNHLDEQYAGETSDIWDNAYVIVDFAKGARAMLELCMFAEGSRFQEEITVVGPQGKIEALVPGPGRFWPEDEPEPVPQIVIRPRGTKTREIIDLPVDPNLLKAGDHNGSTFYQHQKFAELVRNGGTPEVTLSDGAWAVAIGLAAQESARSGQAVKL